MASRRVAGPLLREGTSVPDHTPAQRNTRPHRARGNTAAVRQAVLPTWVRQPAVEMPAIPPEKAEIGARKGQRRKGVWRGWWGGTETNRMGGQNPRGKRTGRGTYVPMGGGHMSPVGVSTVVEGRSQVFIKMRTHVPIRGGTYVPANVKSCQGRLRNRFEIDDWERPTSLAISVWLNSSMR